MLIGSIIPLEVNNDGFSPQKSWVPKPQRIKEKRDREISKADREEKRSP